MFVKRDVNRNAHLHSLQHTKSKSVKILFTFSVDFLKTPKGTALECVKLAIDVGYRHFDGALVYFNEHEVGQAIREKIADGTVRREDIFYCGKVKKNSHQSFCHKKNWICCVILRTFGVNPLNI